MLPMNKCVVLFLFILSACSSTRYNIDVKSQSLLIEELQDNKICKLEYFGDKNPKSIENKLFTKQIEHILNNRGIKLTTNKDSNCTIGFIYNIDGPYTELNSAPIIGVTGTQSTTSYSSGMLSTYGNMSYGSTTTNTYNIPQYGVKGYRYYEIEYYNRWLAMASVNKKGEELWNVYISSKGTSNDLSKIFPLMALVAEDTIMTNSQDTIRFSGSEAQKIKEKMLSIE